MSNNTITPTPSNSGTTSLCTSCQQNHESSIGPNSRGIKRFPFTLGKKTASQIPINPKNKSISAQTHKKIGIFLKNKFHKKDNSDKENLDVVEKQSIPSHEGSEKPTNYSFKKISEFTDWLENNSRIPIDSNQAKGLSLLEKKYPEELKNKIVDQITRSYQTDNSAKEDAKLELIRPQLSSLFMATVDKSIMDRLKSDENSTAAERYQNKQINNQSLPYNDRLMLDHLVQDLQAGRSLDRTGQEKLLSQTKDKLETIDPKKFTPKQHELLQTAKERVANLERALPLVDKSTVNKWNIAKTVAGSVGLGASLTAIGTLIALLVKLGHSTATDETGTSDDTISDQTDAIAAKESEVEAKQKESEELKSQEKSLLDEGANLTEEAVIKNEELAGFDEVVKQNELFYDKIDHGVENPKPNEIGKKIIENFVNEALTKHRENQTAFNAIQNEIKASEGDLKTLQGELEELKFQQGQYTEQKNTNPTARTLQSNHTKTETGILASLGIGALAVTGGASGLFAVNSSKILPKFKLHRANTQAVQSLNKVAQSNQPPLSAVNTIDPINPKIIRSNTL
jgi:Fe-S cluster biosynthesis and repair protein YggX